MSGKTVNIGGDRLGSGAKMNVHLHSYERSTHDLSYIWRNTQAVGTLVPFMVEVGLPGDTFDINLNADVKTMPTTAPLFGTFKLQLDVFNCPVRLYQGKLHNNKLNVGLNMKKIKLPQLELISKTINPKNKSIKNEEQQISKSSLLNYLGINGLGTNISDGNTNNTVKRHKNAVPFFAYWDIYKNYYANKQEEIGMFIHDNGERVYEVKPYEFLSKYYNEDNIELEKEYANGWNVGQNWEIHIIGQNMKKDNILIKLRNVTDGINLTTDLNNPNLSINESQYKIEVRFDKPYFGGNTKEWHILQIRYKERPKDVNIKKFKLEYIDDMKDWILNYAGTEQAMVINNQMLKEPYTDIIRYNQETKRNASQNQQEGLALKTYQSDLFNNWISTEWIDGENGINAITAVDVSTGKLSLDTLNLSQKVYNMLNRVAVSGGSYQDWIEAVYATNYISRSETPIYCGGLSKEIVFQEVVSTASTGDDPLGTLAGRGVLNNKHKGGNITIKVDEPSYIIGIISITPRVDYSQGNRWDTRLKTMDDFHKPALDGIGYQDLITEQMYVGESVGVDEESETLFSAGKLPAWINYMTNYNRCHGHFAEQNNQMFMTLNRRYEIDETTGRIKDLTTYIDPSKYNYIFAQTDIHAMNFWVQVANNITARRKMSAKQIPNL